MQYGIITRNVTDLRAEPRFQSERKSQLLYHEPIAISSERGGYCHIHQSDGYHGWVDRRAVMTVSGKTWREFNAKVNCQITAAATKVPSPEKGCTHPPFLFYGTRLQMVDIIGRNALVRMVDNTLIKLRLDQVAPIKAADSEICPAKNVVQEARRFLGVPYLWGGITPFGFDCSGLTRMIFRVVAGIELPRDSKDQRHCGHWINIDQVRAGDLRFFKGHVAIAIDNWRIIHSSLAGGGVVINSLHPRHPDYRDDLRSIFIEDRRILE